MLLLMEDFTNKFFKLRFFIDINDRFSFSEKSDHRKQIASLTSENQDKNQAFEELSHSKEELFKESSERITK